MLSFVLMIGFSLYLMAYGFIALFKKDWIWKLRSVSARVEGKTNSKRDEESASRMNQIGNVLGTIALVAGIIALALSLASIMLFFQADAGLIEL